MMMVKSYIQIPRQVSEEFWDLERIEHIRMLSLIHI